MYSYEAFARCIGRHTVAVAKALGRSTMLVNKWKEPTTDFSDSGALNPLDRIETTIETALKHGQGREDALAPIQYLACHFGCLLIDLPPEVPTLKNLQQRLAALEDGTITPDERRRIEREIQHLIHCLGHFSKLVEESAK